MDTASIDLHFRLEDYGRTVGYCICESGFVGIKFIPRGHMTKPLLEGDMRVFEVVSSFDVLHGCELFLC